MNEQIFNAIDWKNVKGFFTRNKNGFSNNYFKLTGIIFKHYDQEHKGVGIHLLQNDFGLIDIENVISIIGYNDDIIWEVK